MSRLREVANRLREQEGMLRDGYDELVNEAEREVEQRVAVQLQSFQRLQVASLELLADGIPDQFIGLGRIIDDNVNLREGPGGRYPLQATLNRGDLVVVMGYSGYWAHVAVPHGPTGYVFKDYVQQETAT